MDKGAGGGPERPETTPGLISGDGEFILRLLVMNRTTYECPTGYEDAWEKLDDLNLIGYSAKDSSYVLTGKGHLELDKIFRVFPNGEIGR